jgi:hypothetical protein
MQINVRVGIGFAGVDETVLIAVSVAHVGLGIRVTKCKVVGGASTVADLAIIVDEVLFPGLLGWVNRATGAGRRCEDGRDVRRRRAGVQSIGRRAGVKRIKVGLCVAVWCRDSH